MVSSLQRFGTHQQMTDHSIPSQEPSRLSRFFVDLGTLFFLTNVSVLLGSTICSIVHAAAKEAATEKTLENYSPVGGPDDVANKDAVIAKEAAIAEPWMKDANSAAQWILVAFPSMGFVMGILLCVRRIFLKPAVILGAIGTLLMFRYSVPVPDGTFGAGFAVQIFWAFLVLNLLCSLVASALMSVVRIKWRWKTSMSHQLKVTNSAE